MAHFAELDNTNTVIRVIVISNDDIVDTNGIEREELGVEVCNQIAGTGTWVQTSYNGSFRKVYGSPGYKYNFDKDLFYNPVAPYPSWSLNNNYDWEPPVPKPPDASNSCYWDEEKLSWTDPLDLPF